MTISAENDLHAREAVANLTGTAHDLVKHAAATNASLKIIIARLERLELRVRELEGVPA